MGNLPLFRFRFLVFVVISTLAEASAQSPLQRFENEARVSWTKLIELGSCVEGKAASKSIDLTTGKVKLEEKPPGFRINALQAYCPLRSNGTRLHCQNLDYEFIVDAAGGGKWVIRQLLWKDRKSQEFAKETYWDPDGTVGGEPWQLALAYACRGLMIKATWLPYLASRPSFQVVSVTDYSDPTSDGDLVRVEFVNKEQRGAGVIIEGGEIILDTKRYWQITQARISAHEGHQGADQYDVQYQIKNEFALADGRLPYARRQVLQTLVPFVLNEQTVYETTIAVRNKADVQPFRLPAFGLSEPTKPQ
jgi:hypothetical protein